MSAGKAALTWAENGYAVFPCNPDPGPDWKAPLTRNGFKNATRDPAVVRRMWAGRPDALIGLPTGAVNGVVVVDIDTHPGKPSGFKTIEELEARGIILPPTRAEATTPQGGVHRYYACPPGGMKSAKLTGIEIQADGKYVIAPPSVLADGRGWKFKGVPHDLPH